MALLLAATVSACGGGSVIDVPPANGGGATPATPLDTDLRAAIAAAGLTGDPSAGRSLPDIDSSLAQLGMRLFFSKSLGGEFEAACVSCHHPALGGADALSLSVGVDALDADLLGVGRRTASGAPNVPRNAPTTFNAGLWDRFMFHDGRVQALAATIGANGSAGAIRTPDTALGVGDPDAGATLPAAQARFPVTSDVEMRGAFLAGAGNATLRDRLAARLGDYGDGANELARNEWLAQFQSAFGAGTAEQLVTFDNVAAAIAAYERSQVFVDTPWRDYVAGDDGAISTAAKRGAVLFLRAPNQGGAGCAGCHRGDFFTDELFHTAAFPMIGPGKGDGPDGSDDFGRERETGNALDRYAFRTPSLLNVELTAPYGRTGAYATLTDVVRHYRNPAGSVNAFFDDGGWCGLEQFAPLTDAACAALYPDAEAHSRAALDKLAADRAAGRNALPQIGLNDGQVADIVAFLRTLTDRCAADRACIARWIPGNDGGPDDRQLQAHNSAGNPL